MENLDPRIKQLVEAQLKYENEKASEDYKIAKNLQQQFNQEVAEANPTGLVYENKKKKTTDNTKSLVDVSWELVDPTPNIYNLFNAFNQQFFWNKLLAVCVAWSKRMTTCAGICSYQESAGLCSITLSEPLLKLRPRKDLVETLLHEMIHAYLFVTNNNRDRDGHGPEFHKHMYRINAEAGTNITVYHTFHDEVRLYQQHWWKCNGPCQNRKPFYGMVRRAINRAPGANDRWWAEHSATCGGTFIKVKEPEKKTKAGKENAQPKNEKVKSPDIREYFPVLNNSNKSIVPKNSDNSKIQNINGFKSGQNEVIEVKSESPLLFQGTGRILSASSSYSPAATASTSKSSSVSDYSTARNRWLDKIDNKHKLPELEIIETPKRRKIDNIEPTLGLSNMVINCPVCNLQFPSSDLNGHLDTCLQSGATSSSTIPSNLIECDICCDFVDRNKFDAHKQICLHNISINLNSSIWKDCPICKASLSSQLYDKHVADCVMRGIDDLLNQNTKEDKETCCVCKKMISKGILKNHLAACLEKDIFANDNEKSAFFDDDSLMDEYNRSICSVNESGEVPPTSTPSIFQQDTIIIEDNVSEEIVSCPVCLKRVAVQLINGHLDSCLA